MNTLCTLGATSPTNVMAMQNGLDSVLVSWTSSSHHPESAVIQYRVTADSGGVSSISMRSPSMISLQAGVYAIEVVSFSQTLLPSEAVRVDNIMVRGENREKNN